jgi:hypothetical protein
MLYRELKSSNKSYFRNQSQTTGPEGVASRAFDQTANQRKSQRYDGYRKYGQNSVVIMSTSRWQESEEALQDPQGQGGSSTPPLPHGVMKTEEVRVKYEDSDATSHSNSIELAPMPRAKLQDT